MNTVNNFFWKRIFFLFNFSVICIILVSVTYFAGEKITSLSSAEDTAVNAGNKLTVIIDAGHGGLDGGASTDGGVSILPLQKSLRRCFRIPTSRSL